MKINRNILATLSILGIIPVMVANFGFSSGDQPESADGQTPQWKNLKVLPQDISKDSLMDLMEGYNNALAVNCGYCHTPQKDDPKKLDFPADDKIEKEIARGMIQMTLDLNANYFQPFFPDPKPDQVFVVNCVMCHRGTSNPELYLSKMQTMYKTYDPDRDNRKEKILEQMQQNK